VLQNRLGPQSLRYGLSRRLELFVAQQADAVVGIAQHILDDMQARGIPASKLFHVPNGVDVERFIASPRDTELARELKTAPRAGDGFHWFFISVREDFLAGGYRSRTTLPGNTFPSIGKSAMEKTPAASALPSERPGRKPVSGYCLPCLTTRSGATTH
jgi:glycogen synthase